MSIAIIGQYNASAAASLAATRSNALASAPDPKRFGLDEADRGLQEDRKVAAFAAKLIRSGMKRDNVEAKLRETYEWMDGPDAEIAWGNGFQTLELQFGGKASDGSKPANVSRPFTGTDDAKAFALDKLRDLNKGLQRYNEGVLNFTQNAEKFREDIWAHAYDDFRAGNPEADEAKAIEAADKSLKSYLAHEGKMSDGLIRSALGGLETAFGLAPWSLITENADGTLSLNRTALTFGGQTILEIGADLGQNVDKAA